MLEPCHIEVPGWAPGKEASETPRHLAVFDRGGRAWGVFDHDRLVAATVIDVRRVGLQRDLVQLDWLHVGCDHRDRGLGASLFRRAQEFAFELGAAGLYVSATPSQHTVDFYQRLGCVLTTPDPELFALEPEDIHLEWRPPQVSR